MLTFLAPWWAAGAVAAIGLPLLAHLLSRTRYREVLFPATRFVRQAAQQTTRVERPRHRLLMLLRWLLLLLVVVAFMRPRWLPQAEARTSEQGVALIVLIDASASMQRVEAGATLYERALRRADHLLGALDPSRDVAGVIRVKRDAAALLPELTADLPLLRDALSGTRPSFENADWVSAVEAAKRLATDSSRRIRVVVISDQQGDGPVFNTSASLPGMDSVNHLKIEGSTTNTAVRLVDIRPYPPVAGQPLTAIVELSSFGSDSSPKKLVATLGGERIQRSITLAPGATRRIELTLPTRQPGTQLLRVQIDVDDAMDLDDSAGHVLTVQDRNRALIVHGQTNRGKQLAQRIASVLNPGADTSENLPRVDLAAVDQAGDLVRQANTERLRTVVLLDVSTADEDLSKALSEYMRRGGGVVRVSPNTAGQDALALFKPQDRAGNPQPGDTAASRIDFSLAPLRIFEGPARSGLASLVWPGVDAAVAAERSLALLAANDGRSIVAARSFGRGRMVAINADLSPGPGGLLAEPAFVVLFNELCRYASPGTRMPAPSRPGDLMPAVLRNSDARSLPEAPASDTQRISAPGPYLSLDANDEMVGGVWAEIDPTESDTRTGRNWSEFDQAGTASPTDLESVDAMTIATDRTPPIELWPYLVMGALLLGTGESLAIWRFASGKGGKA